jgi:hypothetical protein
MILQSYVVPHPIETEKRDDGDLEVTILRGTCRRR